MSSVTGSSRAGLASLPADDESIDRIVRRAALVPLVAALAQTTGDLSLLRNELRPDPSLAREPQAGLTPEQRRQVRGLVADTLRALRDGAVAPDLTTTDDEALRRIMAFALGEEVSDDYLPLLIEELALSGEDRRAPEWTKDAIDGDRDFEVVIIGAGMSGVVAAHRLQQAGVPFVVIEKNDDVGGTWLENRYPGCRVDVPNHLYSYSFAQRDDWPQHFSTQPTLLDYFQRCASDLDLRDHIRFGTQVVSAAYDDDRARWSIELRTPDGTTDIVEANVVVSAVGQLNRPSIPDLPGRSRFGGPSFHSAEWNPEVDLAGRRVAVIGTGASGIQLIPEVAEVAAEVFVYQRTPNWFVPAPDYHDAMPDEAQWLLRNVRSYSQWYRFWLFWRLAEGALPAAQVDPDWTSENGSISERNDELRALLTMYIQHQFADAPELLEHVVPRYPPLAKRMLLDNGTWARCLKRANVRLVTDPIEQITETAIRTEDGLVHDIDVIIYATGFSASRFLMPMRVTGRDGVDLHEQWDGNPRAYLGMTVPGFPNLFCLYGPNTNLVANGSIIFFSECEVTYILGCIRLLLDEGKDALDCRVDVFDDYNERIDEGNARMAWGAAQVNSWYKNAQGRVTQNWPFALLEFWQRTRRPDPDDFEVS
jgi:4-hydroxyacetophenone monooxygenase